MIINDQPGEIVVMTLLCDGDCDGLGPEEGEGLRGKWASSGTSDLVRFE